ncbi:Tim44 domain-containing protein [Roseateles sp.]|uniref:Tim44 domain-containing protein n=1 Tax=Roseateles sp. TaxID=1971397 RepID=UPI0037C953DD
MKTIVLAALSAALSLSLVAADVQAKRLSNGGMQRSTPSQPMQGQTPAKPAPSQAPTQQAAAAPAATGAAAAAAAPKRSWMGPVAGLAAGLGLAALASHFGFGAELANFMTMLLIGLVVMMVVGFLVRRFAAKKAAAGPQGLQFAGAGAGAGPGFGSPSGSFNSGGSAPQQSFGASQPVIAPAAAPVASAAAPASDFDVEGFEQIAKRVFIRLQAANDSRDQADLRRFTTPQMYAVIQQELLDRKGEQRTDVLQLQAQVVERAEEHGQQIVSVRFSGLIREQSDAAASNFDEVWHLVRPLDGSQEWAIAGIQSLN